MSCLMIGAVMVSLSGDRFTLEWTHSVEQVQWHETWIVNEEGLRLMKARIKGSGAGMEPGPNAVLEDGWWTWRPYLPPQDQLVLAASGATGGGWLLCDGPDCRELGAESGDPIILRSCTK